MDQSHSGLFYESGCGLVLVNYEQKTSVTDSTGRYLKGSGTRRFTSRRVYAAVCCLILVDCTMGLGS